MVQRPDKNKSRQKRHTRVRAKISGTAQCPRLNVYRSLNHIYAQLVDDEKGVTLASASSVEKGFKGGTGKEAAKKVGEEIAKRGVKAGVSEVVFDRGGYLFHGRVAELAAGAREGGLKF